MNKKKFYAYQLPENGIKGVADSWAECSRIVLGIPRARYRSFASREEAQQWLDEGAHYSRVGIVKNLEPGIYFDAGTGRGLGRVEIRVSDEKGKNQLSGISELRGRISSHGTYVLPDPRLTNNFGELIAMKYALKIALQKNIKKLVIY